MNNRLSAEKFSIGACLLPMPFEVYVYRQLKKWVGTVALLELLYKYKYSLLLLFVSKSVPFMFFPGMSSIQLNTAW